MIFRTFVEMQDNEYLSGLLTKWTTGPEQARRLDNDVVLYVDPYGSHRFVKYVQAKPVAAIQVMVKGAEGRVANAYTAPEYRRKGYGRELVAAARKMFNLTFSDDVSGSGGAFVRGVGEVP